MHRDRTAATPHQRSCYRTCLVSALVLAWSVGPFAQEDSAYHRTIERVLTLLPKRPAQVVVVDTDQVAVDVRRALGRMETFTVRGGRVVYVTAHSEVLRGALQGWSVHEHVLATIIWHEMAHIDGADEIEAQHREERLWKQFLMEQRVDWFEGSRYLTALEGRRQGGTLKESDVEQTLQGPLMIAPLAVIGRSTSSAKRPHPR